MSQYSQKIPKMSLDFVTDFIKSNDLALMFDWDLDHVKALQQYHLDYQRSTKKVYESFKLPLIKVKRSIRDTIDYGLGVYALESIEPKQLISIYPNDFSALRLDNSVIVVNEYGFHQGKNFINEYEVGVGTSRNLSVIGDNEIMIDGFMGHLVNDGNYTLGDTYVNAELTTIGNMIFVFSICDILKGEEILVDYGNEYWNNI